MKIGGMQRRDDESFLSKLQDDITSGCGDQRTLSQLLLLLYRSIGREQAAFPLHSQIELFYPPLLSE